MGVILTIVLLHLPGHTHVHAYQLCIGWAKSACDGFCLETTPCTAASPLWTAGRSGNATHLRTVSGACRRTSGCCIDFEDKLGILQAFPIWCGVVLSC